MVKRIGIRLLCVLVVCGALSSCQKLPSQSNPVLQGEAIKSAAAISLDYGNLISVTSSGPGLALLWFERPDKSIVLVGVALQENGVNLADKIVVIPRR